MFGVISLRRRAAKRWMNVVGIVFACLGLLGTILIPTLLVGVAFLMFGELAPEDVLDAYWQFWIGRYLVLS
ncbi:MAG: hypothetical protein EAS51_00030 [Microbacteriaceae bacterium]|nr:MAG: hypothetical protein EAS51_00030 [Microbacteriaceae bacterium]